MSYSVDSRALILKYRGNGHTLEETFKTFGVAISTIRKWERLRVEKGSLRKKELNRTARIYPGDKLQAYVAEHPDAFLKEIAEHFGGSITGAFNALKREKITYKKKNVSTRSETKKSAPCSTVS